MTRASLIIIGIWSGVLFAVSSFMSLGSLWVGSFYPFTLPFVVQAAVLVMLCAAGLAAKRAIVPLFWITIPLHGLLFLPFYFAITHWPGGDDCPGLAWLFFVGGGSCIAGILAIVFAVIGIVTTVRKRSG